MYYFCTTAETIAADFVQVMPVRCYAWPQVHKACTLHSGHPFWTRLMFLNTCPASPT